LMEILVSGFNFFVLMNLVYKPRWGVLVAHQIGMSTRIVYISIFAYLLLKYVKKYETKDLIHVGMLWLGLTLAFEWLGSFALGRPVEEILVGWNIFAGYMWPYVLLTYLLSNLVIGIALHVGRKRRGQATAHSRSGYHSWNAHIETASRQLFIVVWVSSCSICLCVTSSLGAYASRRRYTCLCPLFVSGLVVGS